MESLLFQVGLFKDYLDMWLTNIGRYQLDGERNGRHSFGISDHEVQSRFQTSGQDHAQLRVGQLSGRTG